MTRSAWLAAGALACGLSSLASSARADVLRSTREQPLVEISHTVDIRITDGVATYTVRRMIANTGKIADEAGFAIDLPAGAAATGLRIRAHRTWYDGELMERAAAAARYQELTGLGAYKPKDPALLQWLWADKLYLQIFPVMPGAVSTVEYTLTVPTTYVHGKLYVSYPRVNAATSTDNPGGLRMATPIVRVHPTWGDISTPIEIDGQPIVADAPIALVPPAAPAGLDNISVDSGASYVSSAIVVPASSHTQQDVTTASVTLDIGHTYKSDLRVELVAPSGAHAMLHDRAGGSENDVKGTFAITLDRATPAAGTWRLIVSDHAGLDTGTLNAWTLELGKAGAADHSEIAATDTPIFIPDAPESATDAGVASISVTPPRIDTWTARLGRVVASDAHAFARLEVDVAPQLRPLPKHAQVVFAIDASFSIGESGLAAQLDIVRAYLAHVPDADVELVAVRRHATRVFEKFVPAAKLEAAVAAAKAAGALDLGNGSALDDGARVAAAALANRNGGPRRVVLATDGLVRSAFAPAMAISALAALSPDTVVHVVIPAREADDRITLTRNDTDPLATIARHHHGILADIKGFPAESVKALEPHVLELVRPTRIDALHVTGVAVADTVLHEGDGLRVMLGVPSARAPSQVELAGEIWSDPVRREVVTTDVFSRATAAFVFGLDDHHDLSDAEMMTVALLGRAVSPVTSYVAAEPGTRPSTIGLPRFGTTGHGSGYGSGSGRLIGIATPPPDLATLIDWRACVRDHAPPRGWHVTLAIETTRDEIVDVQAPDDHGAFATCLIETAWRVEIGSRFIDERHHYTVELHD